MAFQKRQEGGPATSVLINGTTSVLINDTISVESNGTISVVSSGTTSIVSNGTISVENDGNVSAVSSSTTSLVGNGTISFVGGTANTRVGSVPVGAIGGALGGVIAICLGLIVFLLVRLSRARRPSQATIIASEQQYLPYMVDDKHMPIEPAESQQLSQRLAQAEAQVIRLTSERNLAASLVPTTTRDGSDYLREVELINGSIRQLSMRLSTSVGVPSHDIRVALCQGIWIDVLERFHCPLDTQVDACLRNICDRFDNADQARIWKAMTISHLPIIAREDILRTAEALIRRLQIPLQPSDLVPLVSSVALLSRHMAEDASPHAVTHYASGGVYNPDCMETSKPSQGGLAILGTEAFGLRQHDGYIALKCIVRPA